MTKSLRRSFRIWNVNNGDKEQVRKLIREDCTLLNCFWHCDQATAKIMKLGNLWMNVDESVDALWRSATGHEVKPKGYVTLCFRMPTCENVKATVAVLVEDDPMPHDFLISWDILEAR
ncbi:hypothetical protein QOT17_002098 [Balamuthia mandrillaris]